MEILQLLSALKQPPIKSEAALKKRYAAIDSANSISCMLLMSVAHTYYNKKYFKGKLKQAQFRAQKPPRANVDDQDAAGAWFHWNHHIYLDPKIFTHAFDYFRTVMLHEMCHQAQTDIDHINLDDKSLAHGKAWVKWMKHCGLAPSLSAVDYSAIPDGVSEKVRARFMRALNKLNKISTGIVHPSEMKFGQMFAFFDSDDGKEGKLLEAMYVQTKYHPEAHENMLVMVGDYHKPKSFDYHWPNTTMWLLETPASTELKKRGRSIIKKAKL